MKKSIIKWLQLLVATCSATFASQEISITLSERQLCDIELLMNGGFEPLNGFMDKQDYESVIHNMRLKNGNVWPIPIVLDIDDKTYLKLNNESCLNLCDSEGTVIAKIEVTDIWAPNKNLEAQLVYGTTSRKHPGVSYLFDQMGNYYVSGKFIPVSSVQHFDFCNLRKTPTELKKLFKESGFEKVVGFQTRNPMHQAHVELTKRATNKTQAHLLLHPAVGQTKPGDIDYFTRVKCYQALLKHYPEQGVTLSLLPIAMRMAGPKEALWHALIRKNYGCTHFIIGRDHAGPGKDENGKDFYSPYAAQELVTAYEKEIGIQIITSQEMVYVEDDHSYHPIDEIHSSNKILSLSGTELRNLLKEGKPIPEWFSYPDIVSILRKSYPKKENQGITLFFTGLSSSGKSTLAKALCARLMEIQDRSITLLDGDIVRKHLSSELGFSKQHRSLNVRRVGFVSSQIAKNGGIAICALIAPYAEDRLANKNLIAESGNYIEIHVNTPLSICEKRDPKGLYTLARQGKLPQFTGISDPYETPINPEITIDTSECTVEKGVEIIINYLKENGFI